MKRLLPSSLLGQVMLVLAIGLLVAQAISAVLLYRASEERREAEIVNSIAFRIIAQQARAEDRDFLRPRGRSAMRGPGPGPRIGIERSNALQMSRSDERLYDYQYKLRDVLKAQGVEVGKIAITKRRAGDDPFIQGRIAERPRWRTPGWEDRSLIVASVEVGDKSQWLTFRIPERERRGARLGTILLQTLMILGILMALLYFVLRRITRPLATLTERVGDFSRSPGTAVLLEESGPSDTRRLIAAHNAMEARIASLIAEKDVMLGAIGHDLKTPLAALRVRIESVEDENQRARMAASIEDITATLDDILSLARIGRAQGGGEKADLGALVLGIVEEFEDLGEAVTMSEPKRIVAGVHVTWLKRAIRNLATNAVRYGGGAQISLDTDGADAVITVADDGPGIPAARIGEMFEPFTRGEASRNRATGGAGLGLTLARAIAEQHGGTLTIENRAEGGLRAELRIPLSR